MTEELDLTTETFDAPETSEETSLTEVVAPIALMAAAAAGTVYLVRKVLRRRHALETEVHPEAIEATSTEV